MIGLGLHLWTDDVNQSSRDLPHALREAAKRGLPPIEQVTFSTLDLGTNAAETYVRYSTTLGMPGEPYSDFAHPAFVRVLLDSSSVGDIVEAVALLGGLEEHLETLSAASFLPNCSYVQNLLGQTEYPEIVGMRPILTTFLARAKIRRLRGDYPGALEDLKAVARISHHLGKRPIYRACSIQIWAESLLLDECMRTLAQRPTEFIIANCKSVLASLREMPPAGSWLALELIVARGDLADFARHFRPARAVGEVDLNLGSNRDPKVRAAYDAELIRAFIEMKSLLEVTLDDGVEALRRIRGYQAKYREELKDSQLYAWHHVSQLATRLEEWLAQGARRRILASAIQALEQDDVRSARVWSMYIDPFSGRSLRSLRSGTSVRIYSVGRNGRNDWGVNSGWAGKDDISLASPVALRRTGSIWFD